MRTRARHRFVLDTAEWSWSCPGMADTWVCYRRQRFFNNGVAPVVPPTAHRTGHIQFTEAALVVNARVL